MQKNLKKNKPSVNLILAGLFVIGLISLDGQEVKAASCGLKGGLPNHTAALSLAMQGNINGAIQMAEDPFIKGYSAMLGRRYEEALQYLAQSAIQSNIIKQKRLRSEYLARAGYWSTRILHAQGRDQEALEMATATLQHKGSFYALLVDAEKATPHVSGYPYPEFRYTDARTNKALVLAITREESNFIATAKSSANARGAMQIIPPTAKRITSWVGVDVDMQKLSNDMDYNVALGSTFLGFLLERYQNYPALAAAGYNAGEGCADLWIKVLGDPRSSVDPLIWIEAVPIEETRNYIKRVMASYVVYSRHQTARSSQNQ